MNRFAAAKSLLVVVPKCHVPNTIRAMSTTPLNIHSADAWSQHAVEYAERMAVGPMAGPTRVMLQRADALAAFSTSRAILDLGCGPGTVTQQLLNNASYGIPATTRLAAGDLSPGMIEVLDAAARDNAARPDGHPVWKTLETHVLDIQDLSRFSTAAFDHVLAGFVYWFAPEPRRALRETLRVLEPGGVLALTSWHDGSWIRELNAVATAVRPSRPARWFVPEEWSSCDGVKGELEATGFVDVRAEYVETAFPIRDHVDFVQRAVREGNNPPILEATAGMTAAEMDETCARLVERLKARWPVVPAMTPGIAIVATGRKAAGASKV